MDHGKIRNAHKEHLIKSDAEIVDRVNPERIDILDEHGNDPVQEIKMTQNTIYDLHDKCTVSPVKGLSKLVKGLLRFAFLFQDIVKACNGRKPRFCHAVARCGRAEVSGSLEKEQSAIKRLNKRIVIVFILRMELFMKNLLHHDMQAMKIQ